MISGKRRPPASLQQVQGSLFIPHLREKEGRERPCAACAKPLGRTVRLKSPAARRLRGLGTHALQFAFLSSPQKSSFLIVQKEHVIYGKPEVPAVL